MLTAQLQSPKNIKKEIFNTCIIIFKLYDNILTINLYNIVKLVLGTFNTNPAALQDKNFVSWAKSVKSLIKITYSYLYLQTFEAALFWKKNLDFN